MHCHVARAQICSRGARGAWGRPQDVTLKSPQDVIFQRPKDVGRGRRQDVGRERSLALHRGPYGDVHRTSFLWA